MQGVAVAVRNGGLRKENLASPASKPAGAALPELRLRVFCARAASSCPRHGRHRATEFGNRLFAQTSRAAQTLDLFQTLQAAALGFRVVLLQLSAREGVLQLPELAAAAVQARQTRRQLPLQRLLAGLAGGAGKANGRAVGPDALPLPIGEVVQCLGIFAFLACRGGRLRLPECVPVHFLAP